MPTETRRDMPQALLAALTRIDEVASTEARIARIAGRTKRRQLIREWKAAGKDGMRWALSWLSARLPYVPVGGFLTFDEAVAFLRKHSARRLDAIRRQHWSADPGLYSDLRVRLRVAVYFARHAAALFQRKAA